MTIRLLTLGGLRILREGEELPSLPGKQVRRGLLVYLAVERSVTRDALLALVWPEEDPEKARHTLSQTLYELRNELGAGWLETPGEILRVTAYVETDLLDFENAVEGGRLEEALMENRGPFLEGVHLINTRDFQGWVDGVRSRVERIRRRAHRQILEKTYAAGQLLDARNRARAWAEKAPLDDEAQNWLIRLLAETGPRSAALQHYEAFRSHLSRELEVEPLEDTRILVEKIRRGEAGAVGGEVDVPSRQENAGLPAGRGGVAVVPGSSDTAGQDRSHRSDETASTVTRAPAMDALSGPTLGLWASGFPGETSIALDGSSRGDPPLSVPPSVLEISMNIRGPRGSEGRLQRGSRASRAPALLAALLSLPVPFSAQEASTPQARPLEIADMFQIQRVGAPVVSPDGEWVAYTVSTPSTPTKSGETRIWMASTTGGGEPIPMTAEGYSASNPEWSPDGKYLSFMATRGDSAKSQVWVLDRRMGEGQQLTREKWGISGYEWSPDGSRILLTIRDPDPMDTLPAHKKPKNTPPWEIDRLQFKQDYQGYLTGNRHTHLFVFDVATETTTQITSGDYDEGSGVWSPDGTRVAFVSNRTEEPDGNVNSDIWVVDAANTDKGDKLIRITTNPGSDGQPAWSPDGTWIAHITSTEPEIAWYDVSHLALARADGSGEVRALTEALDRNVGSPKYSADGRSIFVTIEDSAEEHLGRVNVRGGRIDRPISGKLTVTGFDLGPDDAVYASVARTDLPGEIFAADDGELTQLTRVNEAFFKKLQLGRVFDATFPSADGTEIEGIFYLPPGYQEGMRYPTLLRIHGGPVSQYSHSFNFEAHLFAANGYVVVTTNPRGSSGYGQDFSHAIWADWGTKDSEDVMAGVDYAIEQGWADPDKLGVGGWSYGGILTDHILVRTDRFEGAITGASEFLYVTNYGHDHYQLWWETELGLPWETREVWERISPFNQVQNITTPTLIMGGEKDWNVPINNGEQLYQALRRMGKVAQLVVYPGQGHGLRVPAYQVDRYERYLAWYDKYVKQLSKPTTEEGRES